MKKMNLFFACTMHIFIALLFYSCVDQKHIDNNKCIEADSLLTAYSSKVNDYYYSNDKRNLDTAISYLNEAVKLCSDKKNIVHFQKVKIYYLGSQFKNAIMELNLIDNSYLSEDYKMIIENQIRIKKHSNEGKNELTREYYQNIISSINSILKNNKKDFENIIVAGTSENVWNSSYGVLLYELFYYDSLLNGKDKALKGIEKMQSELNANEDFFTSLREYLSNDNGVPPVSIPFMD